MSRSSNSLRTSDVITTPIKLKYSSSYDCNCTRAGGVGIAVLNGVNGPVTITGSVSQETLNYYSVKQLFYSNYLTGSFPVSASGYDNSLQSTAASGTLDADLRYFPTESNASVRILSIPRGVYGQKISRNSFRLTSSLYTIVDDGNGNLMDGDGTPYVNSSYYDPEYTDWYVYQAPIHVGNIIYQQGIVIITNPVYQSILPYNPVAIPDTVSIPSNTTPKTIDLLANDISGSGQFVTESVAIFGGDAVLFTNNLDGTITLNTVQEGTYTTTYTVDTEISGCVFTSNQAAVTVTVTPTTTPACVSYILINGGPRGSSANFSYVPCGGLVDTQIMVQDVPITVCVDMTIGGPPVLDSGTGIMYAAGECF